jgi:hypothetical protein
MAPTPHLTTSTDADHTSMKIIDARPQTVSIGANGGILFAAASLQLIPLRSQPRRASLFWATSLGVIDAVGIHFLRQAPHTSRKYLIVTMGSRAVL